MKKKGSGKLCLMAFLLTATVLLTVLIAGGFTPFGDKSLSVFDGEIQYLDFFLYFKRVLAGQDSFGYTFSKTLGGNNAAVLSYYLTSPWNLLLLLFPAAKMKTAFDILVLLKISLASATCMLFFTKRFHVTEDSSLRKRVFCLIFAMEYALGEYCIIQSSNIMWLDGVYMLPLLLLGVYELVRGENRWKLSLYVAMAIVFNWYSAAIGCMFAVFWFVLEMVLRKDEETYSAGFFFRKTLQCVIAMALGVLMSCAIFLPTLGALKSSTRGSLNWGMLTDFGKTGRLTSLLADYGIGKISWQGKAALYIGSLPCIGVICEMFSKKISVRKKILYAISLALCVGVLFWNPLIGIFSMLKPATSYWFRYSFIIQMMLLFIAASYFLKEEEEIDTKAILISTVVFACAVFAAHVVDQDPAFVAAVMTCVFLAGIGVLASLDRKRKRILYAIVLLSCTELGLNAAYIYREYSTDGVRQYEEYVENQKAMIREIQETETGFYRISQTTTRSMTDYNLTALYNESLAYGYSSISGYTSSPDDIQRELLDRLGYRINGENLCVTNDAILSADALLGVRYTMSPYPIEGLEKTSLTERNGKAVYENPYVLPPAFTCKAEENTAKTGNPFTYQNALYRELTGIRKDIFIPVSYTLIREGDVEAGTDQVYSVTVPEGDYTLYADFPWNSTMDADLYVDGVFKTSYACWLSPDVVYIPCEGTQVEVSLKSDLNYDLQEARFYALDRTVLAEMAETVRKHSVESYSIENGYAEVRVQAEAGEKLYLSIPYDAGWEVKNNGHTIDTQLFADCMYLIPLEEGENVITMTYHIRYLYEGFAATAFGILCTVWIALKDRRKMR